MKTLTPEQLASGEWVWDDSRGEFFHINETVVLPTPEPEPEIPKVTQGMKWNGHKFV